MSNFNAFRRKVSINNDCVANYESSFIMEGTSAVTIRNLRLNANQNAAIIITDKEGPDTSLVYSFKQRAKEKELLKGDYYTWNNYTFFVCEDVLVVRETNYKKQKSLQCNVNLIYECDGKSCTYPAYFVSSLSKYIDTTFEGKLNITDSEKPILILPQLDWVQLGAKVTVNGRPYKIIEFDGITNQGIAYCSLDRDFVDKQEDVVISEPDATTLIAGIEQTIKTNYAYFAADCKVEIVSKNLNEVCFIIPYGVEEINITTKLESGSTTVTKYKVVV